MPRVSDSLVYLAIFGEEAFRFEGEGIGVDLLIVKYGPAR
jgi:hypothetical protein